MEGPSLLILRQELAPFCGKKVLQVKGNTHQPKELLKNSILKKVDTWGKHLYLIFRPWPPIEDPIVTKTHFLMFGSYRINDPREGRVPRLELKFKNGTVYFYSCSLRFGADEHLRLIDRRVDIMAPEWNVKHVVKLIAAKRKEPLCDLFLDQTVFAGSGNIVKNEVLFNIRRHPLTPVARIPQKDWRKMAQAVHDYGWNFYNWKKKFELRKHWQVYAQGKCPLCQGPIKRQPLGKFLRRTFYCPTHQPLERLKRPLKVFPVLPVKGPIQPEPRLDH